MNTETFETIFNALNNGSMIGNPAYNMQAVAQVVPRGNCELG